MNQETSNVKSGAAVACRALLGEKLLSKLKTISGDECAHAYVQANCFEWPDALSELRPDGWDALTDKQRHQSTEGKTLWHSIKMVTSDYQQSKAWWLEKLGRTVEAHDEWWPRRFSPNEKLSD